MWYVGSVDPTPREISTYIAAPTPIEYTFNVEQLLSVIKPFLEDDKPDVIIVPNDKSADVIPRLERQLPGGKQVVYLDRGRPMFRSYTLRVKSGRRLNPFRFAPMN